MVNKSMLILAIDSTSYLPRIALVDDDTPIAEITQTSQNIVWEEFRKGDGSYIVSEFEFQIQKLWKKTGYDISQVDIICYSGYSGFEKIIKQGKIFSENLGKKHGIPIMAVDHITAHDISAFIEQKDIKNKFPILVFSASGSHNSFSLIKDFKTLKKLGDTTEFDTKEKKYIGLGSIYFRLVKALGLFDSPSGSNNISEIISSLDYKKNDILVDFVIKKYKQDDLYTLYLKDILDQYLDMFFDLQKYTREELYFSFEEAVIQICTEKIMKIYQEIKMQEIHIVGGIAMNDTFFQRVQNILSKKEILVCRPLKKYRFDNASMLGVLAFYMNVEDVSFESSYVVTK